MPDDSLLITAFPIFSNHSTNVSEDVLNEVKRIGTGSIDVETQLNLQLNLKVENFSTKILEMI